MQDSFTNYKSGDTLIQPRGGRTTESAQKRLWDVLEEAGSDILPLTIDSKSRLGQIDSANSAYANSKLSGLETLNGFPLLSAEVSNVRELIASTKLPVSLRHGTPYAYDLVRRALEVGVLEIEGGPLSYSLPYSRDSDLVRVINSWKESEISCRNTPSLIVRETFGILTACLVPPIVSILVNVLECAFIETFKSGVPMASFGATGSPYQDDAAIRAFREIYPWFRERMQLGESNFLIAYHHWMGPFPKDRKLAEEIISIGSHIAKLTNSNKVVTKTIDEALGVPTDETNAEGVRLTKSVLRGNYIVSSFLLDANSSEHEAQILVRESKLQLEKLLMRTDNISELLLESVRSGLIDPPFAPHRSCSGNLKALRAKDGSIRVTMDQPGVFSKHFIDHEASFLGTRKYWNAIASDDVKLDLQYPFAKNI
jgi:methylaspartate mutase epsilon subunit